MINFTFSQKWSLVIDFFFTCQWFCVFQLSINVKLIFSSGIMYGLFLLDCFSLLTSIRNNNKTTNKTAKKSLHCSFYLFSPVQLISHVWLCDPMSRSTPGLLVHRQLPEFTQTHVHWIGDAIQPSHPLSSPSSPAPKPSQHQGLFQWVNSLHEVAKVLEFQLQHQSFQWTPRTDLL